MTDFLSRQVHCLDIDGNAHLSSSLVSEIKRVCDDVDDGKRGSIVLLHVRGMREVSNERSWPGDEHEIDVHLVTPWEQVLRRLERLPAIIIGTAEGTCGGVALEVLLVTDYRVVGTNFSVSLQGAMGPMWPGMAIHRLANQLGIAKSRKLILFGGELSASRAQELGLVDEVASDVQARISRFVETLQENADVDIAVRRTLLLEAMATPFEDALGAHLAGCDRLIRSIRQLKTAKTAT